MNSEYEVKSILDLPVEELELSERITKLLKDAEINTIGQLAEYDAEHLTDIWGINLTYYRQIVEKLISFGICLPENGKLATEAQKAGKEQDISPLDYPIEDLNLSIRPQECLRRAGIKTIGEILEHSDVQLLEIRNFNVKCLWEVEIALDLLGLELPEHGIPFGES